MVAPPLHTSFSSITPSSLTTSRKGMFRPPNSPKATASVQVVVRLRPLNDREKKHGTLPVISASTSDKTVTVIKGSGARQVKSSYKFDSIFTSFSTQEDVFEATLQPIIRDVLNGYESTVFAYGQTGTGKTHTMEGDLSDVQQHGVIPRSAAAIFDALGKNPNYVSSDVYCSLLEIYNEELSDLLVDRSSKRWNSLAKDKTAGTKLTIMEGENGPFCRGLTETKVTTAEELLALMQKAHQQRHTGETEMNKESSRSHCIFTLRVKAKRQLADGSILEVGGKLHCVDLAGSECAKACGNAGQQQATRERERMNINRSLLTLGRVVKLLKERSEKPSSFSSVRIPYRDSKLTRILQESLGGRCKTCLIATISPSVTAIEESMSTLNYAQAANGIINKPITTSLMTVGGFDNKSPKGDMSSGAGASIEHWHEMECRLEYMQSQVDEAQQALARKHIQQQEFVERAERAELAAELAEQKFEKASHDISILENKVEIIMQQLAESEKSLRETNIVLGATQQTEFCLTEEATALIEVLKSTITDGDRMHQALLEKRKEDVDRKTATNEYQSVQNKLLNDLLTNLEHIDHVQKKHRKALEAASGDHKAKQLERLSQHSAVVEEMKKDCVSDIDSLKTSIHDGVLPVFRTLTLSSKEKLKSLSKLLADGEENLHSKCQSILNRLSDNSNRITEFESSYDTSSKNVLATLASHLETAKQNLNETVVKITTALEKANTDRQIQRKMLNQSISDFKHKCNGSIDELGSLSIAHINSMHQSIQTMKDGHENRSNILQSISHLDQFLGSKKDEYVQKLERQLNILTKQHESLISSHQRQQQMNKALVSNVMSGVRSLVENEMKSLDDFQSQNFSSFIKANEESKTCNEDVGKTMLSTLGHLGSVNTQLNKSIKQNFVEQDELSMALERKTSKFDASMKSTVLTLHNPIEIFSNESTEALQKFDEEDRNTNQLIIDTTKTSVEVVSNQLISDVQEGVKAGMSDLQISTTEGFKYVREQVINPVRTEIVDNILSSQDQLNDLARNDLTLFETNLEEGEKEVVEEVNKGIEIASAVEQRLEVGASETFIGSINKHKDFIRGSQWLEDAMIVQEKNITDQVSKSSTLVSSSTDRLGGFARDIILVQHESPEIEERSVPAYSNHLTSTKDPMVILRENGLCGGNDQTNENNENQTIALKTKIPQKESSPQPPRSNALRDQSGSVNCISGIDVSPPLKRAIEKTRSSRTKKGSKRIKIRQR